VGLLGPLTVTAEGSAVLIGAAKERSVLAVLALRAGRAVSGDELIGALWGDDPPPSAHKNLQTYVSALRRVLPERLIDTVPGGYRLALAEELVDVFAFEGLAAAGQRALASGDPAGAVGPLGEAVGLWRGQPLAELAEHPWGIAEVTRLEELYRGCQEDLAEARLGLGQHRGLVGDLEAAVTAEPLRERRWAQLMLGLYRCGRQADALRAYQRLRQVLGEELGIEPSAELVALEDAMLLQKPDLDWAGGRWPAVSGWSGGTDAAGSDLASSLPSGTVTFLFTDIEGSTRLFRQLGEQYRSVLDRQRQLLRAAVIGAGGFEVGAEGDGMFFAIGGAGAAVAGAVMAQLAVAREHWPEDLDLRVRMGLHTGEASPRDGNYVAIAVHQAARVAAAAHGSQILVSEATAAVAAEVLPEEVSLADLGRYRLKDFDTAARLFQVCHPGLRRSFGPARARSASQNLPRPLTSLVGRERETLEVGRLMEDALLLTLIGPGGSGKTRLAIAVASRSVAFRDGAYFVDLASLSDPRLVTRAVADAVGVDVVESSAGSALASLLGFVEERKLLIILDNCEHLLTACAVLVEELLQAAPDVRVLATSRESLGVPGEVVWPVPSLAVPDSDGHTLGALRTYPAVQLFLDRARAAWPNLIFAETDAVCLADIVVRLDGIPLALELAAARVGLLSLGQIARRLEDRFRLLNHGPRTAPPRQQTLAAAIEWSYDLLSEPEQIVFRRLSVLAGSFTVEAAEAVCLGKPLALFDMLDLVAGLVAKSMLVIDDDQTAGRYRLLESIGAYAAVKLAEAGEDAELRDRHLAWFLELAERAEPELEGTNAQRWWLDVLESEHDNLRAALDWALHRSGKGGVRLAVALSRFWDVRGYISEGRRWIDATLASNPCLGTLLRLKALLAGLRLAGDQDDLAVAEQLGLEALELAQQIGDKRWIAVALNSLANVEGELGRPESADERYRASLVLAREVDDKRLVSHALGNLGIWAQIRGDLGHARAFLEESLVVDRELGDMPGVATVLKSLAQVDNDHGDYDIARIRSEEVATIWRQLGDQQHLRYALKEVGRSWMLVGDCAQARRYLETAVALRRKLGLGPGPELTELAEVCRVEGDTVTARRLLEERLAAGGRRSADRWQASIRLANIVAGEGDFEASTSLYYEVLAEADPVGDVRYVIECLEGRALALAAEGNRRHAVCLLGVVDRERQALGLRRPPYLQDEHTRQVLLLRERLGDGDFQSSWVTGEGMPLNQAIRTATESG
jgi:predicted ATPase/DNA-binding SARP family transcriptional activator/class 3 adenylate cyclase